MFHTTIRHERFTFADLRELLAKANEEKSGDRLAGIAAASERERVAAKLALADVPLSEIASNPVIDGDKDDVTRLLWDAHDQASFRAIQHLTVGEFREHLLDDATGEAELRHLQKAILPEMAAAVAKLMSNKDLVLAASKIRNVTRCRNTMGQRGVLGIRVQPNHPADDLTGILLAAADGILFGCGDAVLGVNPATESVDVVGNILRGLDRLITHLGVPTQACVLAHISTQLACMERGDPVDLLFQSIAGTQAANASFGITLAMLMEGRERTLEQHRVRRAPDRRRRDAEPARAAPLGHDRGVDRSRSKPALRRRPRVSPFWSTPWSASSAPSTLRQAAIIRAGLEDHFRVRSRPTDGLRRLLHQPRRRRPEFRGQSADAGRRNTTASWACRAPAT